VVTPEGTLYTVCCEGIINQHPEVRRSALVGIGSPPAQEPVVCVELWDGRHWKGSNRLKEELLELARRYEITRPIRKVLFHKSFPVDIRHNAKIFREKLAEWATRQFQ
ncbi:MAG TPA: peptide synthase, partial [Acidobacteriota bacterium]|nr:peptide synthase [Acidobacteriota bacterium]